jgi:hypothetical protein
MKRDHIKVWRNYLAEQMQERFGVANEEAQKAVASWLRSMGCMPRSGRIKNHRYTVPMRQEANRSARA